MGSHQSGDRTPPERARRGNRLVVFAGQEVVAAVFDRSALLSGNVIDSPAVIEEAASTTILHPGDSVTVNRFGHLVMHLGMSAEGG